MPYSIWYIQLFKATCFKNICKATTVTHTSAICAHQANRSQFIA